MPRAALAGGLAVGAIGGRALLAELAANRVERQVPADGAFLMIDGRQMHYLDRSKGPEIVSTHELGRAVALALALDYPEAVGRLTLITPLTHPQDTVSDAFEAASEDLVAANDDLPGMVAHYPSSPCRPPFSMVATM